MSYQAKTKLPFISVVIPTYNNDDEIEQCLLSIKLQSYPKNKMEIIICDGGSIDATLNLAKKYGCVILHNKKKLAEYGVSLGFKHAIGDIVTILAADNELYGKHYFTSMAKTFNSDDNIILAYPKQISSIKDTWIARYINTFTDPFNHFVYGYAANSRTFEKIYKIKKDTSLYKLYEFTLMDYPMIALAQGVTVRKTFKRKESTSGDDLSPILDLIKEGYDLAYIPSVFVVHHTMKSLQEFIRKQRWAIDNYLTNKNYGLRQRKGYFSKKRLFYQYIWPFYAASIIFPFLIAINGYLKDKESAWIYHPLLTYIVFLLLITELTRVKILKLTKVIERKKS